MRFSLNYEVCKCRHVTLGEIVYAIKELKASSLEEITKLTDAGSVCGACISAKKDINEQKLELYIEDILKQLKVDKNG